MHNAKRKRDLEAVENVKTEEMGSYVYYFKYINRHYW
jgi:hypothetical protein